MINQVPWFQVSHAVVSLTAFRSCPPHIRISLSKGSLLPLCASTRATKISTIVPIRLRVDEKLKRGRKDFHVFMRQASGSSHTSCTMEREQETEDTESGSKASNKVGEEVKVLRPVSVGEGTGGNGDVLLLVVPGMLGAGLAKKCEEYVPLARTIQETCPLRLWVAFIDINCLGGVPTAEAIEKGCIAAKAKVGEMGYKFSADATVNTFLAAHSAGALQGWRAAMKQASGFINLAGDMECYEEYPKPVLTLNGDRDGQLVLGLHVKRFGKVSASLEDKIGEVNMVVRKPVVIVRGMNHGQVSGVPPLYERGDLDPELSLEEALGETAALMSAWLVLNTVACKDATWQSAYARLHTAVRDYQAQYRRFWEAMDEPIAEVVQAIQVRVARAQGLLAKQVVVNMCTTTDCFVFSKPWVNKHRREVHTYAYLAPQGNRVASSTLWVKMKRAEALLDDLGLEPPIVDNEAFQAATINKETFERALGLVSEEQRVKYERQGRKVVFQGDAVMGSQEWIPGDVKFLCKGGEGVADVQSPVLMSPVDAPLARFAGMHYMKVLTVGRAMEWLLHDCYR